MVERTVTMTYMVNSSCRPPKITIAGCCLSDGAAHSESRFRECYMHPSWYWFFRDAASLYSLPLILPVKGIRHKAAKQLQAAKQAQQFQNKFTSSTAVSYSFLQSGTVAVTCKAMGKAVLINSY